MPEHIQRRSRRAFLLTMGAGAAGAAAIAARRGPSSVVTGKIKAGSRGYQASEHVNNYYRTTKV